MEFIVCLQQRGLDTRTKTLLSEAVAAMLWRGTARGASIFCSTAKYHEIMAPSPVDTRFFRLKELRDAQQLKAYLRKPHAELLTQLHNIRKQEAEEPKRVTDPLCRAIFEKVKSSASLASKLKRMLKKHTAVELAVVQAIVDRLQTSEDPLAVQRDMLLEVLDGLGRQPQDVALFGVAAAPADAAVPM
jgi:hypothetical protein